jgi:hypothetical protein
LYWKHANSPTGFPTVLDRFVGSLVLWTKVVTRFVD